MFRTLCRACACALSFLRGHDIVCGSASVARIEGVRAVPRKVGPAQIRDVRAATEMREFPGPTRECAESDPRRQIELTVAGRGVVTRSRKVENDVAVERQS